MGANAVSIDQPLPPSSHQPARLGARVWHETPALALALARRASVDKRREARR